MAEILVVDDEENIREYLADALELAGHQVTTAKDGADAIQILSEQHFALMMTDLKMPTVDGISLIQHIRPSHPEMVIIVLTAHGSIDAAVEAMKLGAADFLQKPISSPKELRQLVASLLATSTTPSSPQQPQRSADDVPTLTYGAAAMEPVMTALQKVAPTRATVLLTGESGTGKEVAARSIHVWSDRSSGPFIAVNCAALSEQLLESELFGHEKGAFTGADQRKEGLIEHAQGGTFFLDEVGEMKLELQAKLLRVLQERSFTRIGGSENISCDVRWIAATNRDLLMDVQQGLFREDLYHRLAVFPIQLPPLRERKEDILPIAESLLTHIGVELGKAPLRLTQSAQELLKQNSWPGNVRALSNALERAGILADGNDIDRHHIVLPESHSGTPSPLSNASQGPLTMADAERTAIIQALEAVGGNRKQAAERLGIAVRTLYDKLKKYDLS